MTAIPLQPKVVDEPENPLVRAPLVEGDNDFASVTKTVAAAAEGKTPRGWYLMFGIAIALLANLGAMVGYLVFTGVGVWGNNVPVGWGWPIVNFVFWVGIGHAGTLDLSRSIPASGREWRTSINRFVRSDDDFRRHLCRRYLPGDSRRPHLGGLLDVPVAEPDGDVAELPQSPLMWDVFAVSYLFH